MKRIELDMVEEDRISALPDCLLLEILSRLPSIEDAVKTGALSKRWEHLWTWLPTLIFRQQFFNECKRLPDFVSIVNKILIQCRQLKLKHLELDVWTYDSRYDSQVNNWIRYAIRCNVEELDVNLLKDDVSPQELCVDQSFFICSCFTVLRVTGCKLNPVGAISWKNLKSLHIFEEYLDDDLIENILSGSPLLETLSIRCCYGFSRLNITSKILKNLAFCGSHGVIEINAPNISLLTIQDYKRFHKPLLVDVSSLVRANFDYMMPGYYDSREEKLAEEEKNLKDFILNLPYVKELKIGGWRCSEVAYRLEAKGFVFPSNMKVVTSSCWFP